MNNINDIIKDNELKDIEINNYKNQIIKIEEQNNNDFISKFEAKLLVVNNIINE